MWPPARRLGCSSVEVTVVSDSSIVNYSMYSLDRIRCSNGLDCKQVSLIQRCFLLMLTKLSKPGVFQAAYASSAVVESITDFWQYFDPIRQFMSQNCSNDVQAVIKHVDSVFTSNNQAEIDALKSNWNLGNITHLDDVAGARK